MNILFCKRLTLLAVSLTLPFAVWGKSGKEIIRENGFKTDVPPILTTKWAQDGGGENAMLPYVNAPDSENRLAETGCGATALAQILKRWNKPIIGKGCNAYHWEHPHTKELVSRWVDFSESAYDWGHMIDLYFRNGDRTQTQINAVAKLMYDIGIALEMQYKDSSTATQIEYIATALKKFYGYNPYLRVVRFVPGGYTMDEWLTMIYRELSEGRPILMGANNYNGQRHIFVADGYDEEGRVHFNLGHANDSENKYYDLTSPGQGMKDWLYNMRMIIGIYPGEITAETTEIHVSKPGGLLQAMGGEAEAKKICRLKVTGQLGKADINVLKRLCRADVAQKDISEIGQLSYLDLSETTLENNELPDSAFWYSYKDEDNNNRELPCYTLQTVKLPSNLKKIGRFAFRSCLGLYEVTIPSSVTSIGYMTFFGCRYLEHVVIPESVTQIGTLAFGRAKIDTLEVAAGNKNYYVENNTLFTADGKAIIAYTGKEICDYVIPEGVEKIADPNVFSLKSNLVSITIPASLTTIDNSYFRYCPGITDIYSYATLASVQGKLMDWIRDSKIVLHVLIGFKEKYEEAYRQVHNEDWSGVGTIVEDIDPSFLKVEETLGQSSGDNQKVYDINGRRIPESLRRSKQVYIFNGKKEIKR